jgi:hypothetical protein
MPVWLLLQRTEIEPAGVAGNARSAEAWEQLGVYSVRASCAQDLKARVRADEAEGSQAVFDESHGTMAITVLVREAVPSAAEKPSPPGQNIFTKRVRHYECRTVQVRQPDSWLRRKLLQLGLGS